MIDASWSLLLILAGYYLLLAQPGAIPVAWAAARRHRSGSLRHRILAGIGGWGGGVLFVAVLWCAIFNGFAAARGVYLVFAYPPAWLLAWALRRPSHQAKPDAPPTEDER
jgi:hypothetical protein